MRNDIDRICERIWSAQSRDAARIFLSLTAFRRHEVMVRMGQRSREAAGGALAIKKAAAGGGKK